MSRKNSSQLEGKDTDYVRKVLFIILPPYPLKSVTMSEARKAYKPHLPFIEC